MSAAGLAFGLGGATVRQQKIESHYYSWNEPNGLANGLSGKPFTTDPSIGKLTGGSHHRLFLDGKDVSEMRVTRLMTGENGWIEYLVKSDGGPFPYVLNEDKTDVKRFIVRGRVQYFNEKDKC